MCSNCFSRSFPFSKSYEDGGPSKAELVESSSVFDFEIVAIEEPSSTATDHTTADPAEPIKETHLEVRLSPQPSTNPKTSPSTDSSMETSLLRSQWMT